MKLFKLAIMTLALLGGLPAMAQKLETRDFKVTDENTARIPGSELIDENSGERAALIKIYTPFKNEELSFDGGLYPILGRKQAGPGEVWLYVPARIQKVSITHPKYEPKVFWLEGVEAESGKTYSVNLNVEGRNVTLIASLDGADVSVDDVPVGKSPVNIHMPLGTHAVTARLGNQLYEDRVTLTRDGDTTFELQMEDENLKYGDVEIEVADNAELWFQDKYEGNGSMQKRLRAATYVVTSKRPDHDDQTTTFTVEPGKTTHVTATAPIPHLGYMALVTEPEHGVTVTEGDSIVTLLPTMQLPVASYEYTFSKRGYYPQVHAFRIEQGETLRDTIRMERIQYVKKTTGYAAVSFVASGNPGVAFTIGGYYQNVNLEASYNLGLSRSKGVTWYDREDKLERGTYTYRMDEIAVKAGYQLRFAERFGLTPQVGYLLQRLSAKNSSEPGNGFTQSSVTIGARLSYHPIPHVGFFLTPEYGIPVGKKGDIVEVFSKGKLTRGGFRAAIGVSVSL